MNKLFDAVEKKNVAEVEEILKQCTQEILEFRGGMVSIFFFNYLLLLNVFVHVFQQQTNQKYDSSVPGLLVTCMHSFH